MNMLSSVKPPMWPISPELTEAPELWRGLLRLYPFWEAGGSTVFDVSMYKKQATLNSSAFWSSSGVGTSIEVDDSGDVSESQTILDGADTFTIFVQGRTFSYGSDGYNALVSTYGDSNVGPSNRGVSLIDIDDGRYNLFFYYDTNGNAIGLDFDNKGTNSTYKLAYRLTRSSLDGFLDGKFMGSQSQSNRSIEEGGQPLRFGRREPGVNAENRHDGEYDLVAIWDRALSDAEMFQIGTDPFAMLRARSDL